METDGSRQWTTDSSVHEDGDTEETLCGIQESSIADLCLQPQLAADVQAVRTLYSDAAVSVRVYGSIDDVDVDLNIKTGLIDKQVAKAWGVNSSEPIVIRLHFSYSQYLDGPAPAVKVFQPSNTDHFSLGKQLQNLLKLFISHEWNQLSNETIAHQRKCRPGWSRPRGTINEYHAKLKISFPLSNCGHFHESTPRRRTTLPALKQNPLTNLRTVYTIKHPPGKLFSHTAKGKNMSAVRSSAQMSNKQLVALLFSSKLIGHCKSTPTLQHGFLVQIMKYAEQRLPTLNEYCVVCDDQHVFQNGPTLKPAVCTRELCVFSFHTLGVMSAATDSVATGAEVVDLLVAMCRAALQSPRKDLIFEPYPCVVDPHQPEVLAFSPRRKNYDRLQKALDSVLLVRQMAQGSQSELKKQMDKCDHLAYPLLQWILRSNRSHIVKLPRHRQLEFMHTPHQFLLISSPPLKETEFQTAKKHHGSTFAFHGSHIENWHSILRNGLVDASFTKLQLHGAAYGKGIYLSPFSGVSFGYSEMGKGQHNVSSREELLKKYNRVNKVAQGRPGQERFLQSRHLNCLALCEVITSKALQKHKGIWVCSVPDHVCTRFLFVYENSQVGDVHINTQEVNTLREIQRVIASKIC